MSKARNPKAQAMDNEPDKPVEEQQDASLEQAEQGPGAAADSAAVEALKKQLVLTGADIVAIGEDAELLVGGKNYNTALISQVSGIRAPQFRAISSDAFHMLLDLTKVNATMIRSVVDKEYNRTDWADAEINKDSEFLQKFVRRLGREVKEESAARASSIAARMS